MVQVSDLQRSGQVSQVLEEARSIGPLGELVVPLR